MRNRRLADVLTATSYAVHMTQSELDGKRRTERDGTAWGRRRIEPSTTPAENAPSGRPSDPNMSLQLGMHSATI
jgi:hypothetical protein